MVFLSQNKCSDRIVEVKLPSSPFKEIMTRETDQLPDRQTDRLGHRLLLIRSIRPAHATNARDATNRP